VKRHVLCLSMTIAVMNTFGQGASTAFDGAWKGLWMSIVSYDSAGGVLAKVEGAMPKTNGPKNAKEAVMVLKNGAASGYMVLDSCVMTNPKPSPFVVTGGKLIWADQVNDPRIVSQEGIVRNDSLTCSSVSLTRRQDPAWAKGVRKVQTKLVYLRRKGVIPDPKWPKQECHR
jgi:hypothetical protein